ncbi:MAG: alpha/beta hydrolase [Thermodesulfobacteriota bacterium]
MTAADLAMLTEAAADHRLPYGPDPQQFGDLYLPGRPGPHPVIVMLHGGCWQAGYGLGHMGQLCAALRNEGFAVWNLEYRRLGNGGGWPVTFRDVSAGSDFLKEIAGRFLLDLSRPIAVGHSAGGHLALWLAGRHRLPAASPLFSNGLPMRGVLVLAGIPDLAEGAKRGICGGACRDLAGGSPEEVPDRYRQASPMALLPFGVPQRHLIGLEDEVIPVDYIRKYVAAAGKLDDVRVDLVPDAGHYELIVPRPPAWTFVRNAALAIFNRSI